MPSSAPLRLLSSISNCRPTRLSSSAQQSLRFSKTVQPPSLRASFFTSRQFSSLRTASVNLRAGARSKLPHTLIGRAGFSSYAPAGVQRLFQQANYKTLFLSSAGVVGSVVLLDGFLNRDKRVEPLSAAQQSLLNSSFQHTGVGLAITSVLARYMFKNGLTARMMMMNPLLVAGLGLAGSVGTMLCTLNTSPSNTVPKYGFWLAFSACQAATLSPLYFFAPALLSRAALYTVGVVGSLSYVGATAKNDRFLFLGGPLLAGVSVVALSSLAPLVLPLSAARTLMVTESISLYGGLAVFSGFVLYDTQKILHHGKLVEQGRMQADPVNESVGLIMDSINIFIRMVQILAMQSGNKK